MFRTDKDSLEKISFRLNDRDLANFRFILEHLKSDDLLKISETEYKRVTDGLNKIAGLKLDGKIYGFHVRDAFCNNRCGGEGVELYLRQGNLLEDWFMRNDRDYVYSVGSAVDFLKKHGKSTIYTGPVDTFSGFLGLPHMCDDEDPVVHNVLTEEDILAFQSNDIEVISLDYLM